LVLTFTRFIYFVVKLSLLRDRYTHKWKFLLHPHHGCIQFHKLIQSHRHPAVVFLSFQVHRAGEGEGGGGGRVFGASQGKRKYCQEKVAHGVCWKNGMMGLLSGLSSNIPVFQYSIIPFQVKRQT
jgi:hypothetical protein